MLMNVLEQHDNQSGYLFRIIRTNVKLLINIVKLRYK